MDTSAVTSQAGIRTHILTTPELEFDALDRSATTLPYSQYNRDQWCNIILKPSYGLTFQKLSNRLTGKMAIDISEPFKTLHNFLLLHYHTFQYHYDKGMFVQRVVHLSKPFIGPFCQTVFEPFKTLQSSKLERFWKVWQFYGKCTVHKRIWSNVAVWLISPI